MRIAKCGIWMREAEVRGQRSEVRRQDSTNCGNAERGVGRRQKRKIIGQSGGLLFLQQSLWHGTFDADDFSFDLLRELHRNGILGPNIGRRIGAPQRQRQRRFSTSSMPDKFGVIRLP